MFQSNHCERLPVPTIEKPKYGETRHRDAENVSQIGRLKTCGMAPVRIFQQLRNQGVRRPHEPGSNLRPPIVNANAVAIVAHTSIKSRMNPQLNVHWR